MTTRTAFRRLALQYSFATRLALQVCASVILVLCFVDSPQAAGLLTNSGDNTVTVAQGSSVTTTVSADFRRYPISFSVSRLPQGVSATFSRKSCYRDCSTQLTINASSSAQAGTYNILITGKNYREQGKTSLALSVVPPQSATVNDPTITPNGGSFTNSATVTLQTSTSGASIFYTTDGTNPTQSSKQYTAPFVLTGTSLVKAQAFKSGMTSSSLITAWFTQTVSGVISLAWMDNANNENGFKIERKTGTSGTFAQLARVGANISSYTDSGLIAGNTYCYRVSAFNSTGGSGYSNEACKAATAPAPNFDFSLTNGGNKSVSQGQSVANTVTATVGSGQSQSVSFSTSGLPTGATASFTSSNSCSPTCSRTLNIATSASTPVGTYTITVTGAGGGVSKTTNFSLTMNLPASVPTVTTPTISPAGGTFTGSVAVALQTTTAGAVIFYTTNGSTPTESSTPYTGPITLTSSTALNAKAFKAGSNPSTQAIGTFTIVAPAAQLILTWQDNSANETNFGVERKTGTSGTFTQIALLGANIVSYLDTNVTRGLTYCYRLRATNSAGVSPYTNEVCGTVL